MLIPGSRLIGAPVMGLQTGSELGRLSRAVIDPATLKILAYEVTGPMLDLHPSLLRIADVREFSDIGVIVDSSDEFVSPTDVIKLGEIYDLRFQPVGMQVLDEKKHKLGKVESYTIDTSSFVIQQLSIKRPFLKSFNDTQLLVHRTQITEINDKAIIVHSERQPTEPVIDTVRDHAAYVNPFRKPAGPQAEHSDHR